MFFSGLVLRIKIKKRWTSLTDYVDFCSVLHGLQIAEYSSKQRIYDQLTSEYGEKFDAEATQYAIDNLDE